jgi:hypothetical protein
VSAKWSALLLAVGLQLASAVTASAQSDTSAFVGVWRGTQDGLPSVTLTITDEDGGLAGAVLFYLIRREEGKAATSSPGIPEPLFHLKPDGKSLEFQVSHRRAHAGTSHDPPVTLRLRATGPNEAELLIGSGATGMKMVREQ